jgi:hypothetical protein
MKGVSNAAKDGGASRNLAGFAIGVRLGINPQAQASESLLKQTILLTE